MTVINSAVSEYLNEKQKLDSENTTADHNGTREIKKGCEESYLKALTELNDSKTDLPVIKIPVSTLHGLTLLPVFAESIRFMIDFDS